VRQNYALKLVRLKKNIGDIFMSQFSTAPSHLDQSPSRQRVGQTVKPKNEPRPGERLLTDAVKSLSNFNAPTTLVQLKSTLDTQFKSFKAAYGKQEAYQYSQIKTEAKLQFALDLCQGLGIDSAFLPKNHVGFKLTPYEDRFVTEIVKSKFLRYQDSRRVLQYDTYYKSISEQEPQSPEDIVQNIKLNMRQTQNLRQQVRYLSNLAAAYGIPQETREALIHTDNLIGKNADILIKSLAEVIFKVIESRHAWSESFSAENIHSKTSTQRTFTSKKGEQPEMYMEDFEEFTDLKQPTSRQNETPVQSTNEEETLISKFRSSLRGPQSHGISVSGLDEQLTKLQVDTISEAAEKNAKLIIEHTEKAPHSKITKADLARQINEQYQEFKRDMKTTYGLDLTASQKSEYLYAFCDGLRVSTTYNNPFKAPSVSAFTHRGRDEFPVDLPNGKAPRKFQASSYFSRIAEAYIRLQTPVIVEGTGVGTPKVKTNQGKYSKPTNPKPNDLRKQIKDTLKDVEKMPLHEMLWTLRECYTQAKETGKDISSSYGGQTATIVSMMQEACFITVVADYYTTANPVESIFSSIVQSLLTSKSGSEDAGLAVAAAATNLNGEKAVEFARRNTIDRIILGIANYILSEEAPEDGFTLPQATNAPARISAKEISIDQVITKLKRLAADYELSIDSNDDLTREQITPTIINLAEAIHKKINLEAVQSASDHYEMHGEWNEDFSTQTELLFPPTPPKRSGDLFAAMKAEYADILTLPLYRMIPLVDRYVQDTIDRDSVGTISKQFVARLVGEARSSNTNGLQKSSITLPENYTCVDDPYFTPFHSYKTPNDIAIHIVDHINSQSITIEQVRIRLQSIAGDYGITIKHIDQLEEESVNAVIFEIADYIFENRQNGASPLQAFVTKSGQSAFMHLSDTSAFNFGNELEATSLHLRSSSSDMQLLQTQRLEVNTHHDSTEEIEQPEFEFVFLVGSKQSPQKEKLTKPSRVTLVG